MLINKCIIGRFISRCQKAEATFNFLRKVVGWCAATIEKTCRVSGRNSLRYANHCYLRMSPLETGGEI